MLAASRRLGSRVVVTASILASLAALGCGSDRITAPSGPVRVTVSPTWITGASTRVDGAPGIRFSIDAAIHNDGPTDVQFTLPICASPIERRSGSHWVPAVAGGFCILLGRAPTIVAAHTTVTQHFDVGYRLAGAPIADVPVWTSRSATGVYRVHFDLTTVGPAPQPLPESESASPQFVVFD